MSLEELKKKLVSEAAILGGDAVIIGRTSDQGGSIIVPIGNIWVASHYDRKKLVGKVIININK